MSAQPLARSRWLSAITASRIRGNSGCSVGRVSPSDPHSDPQKAERAEPGRGRGARTPSEIPRAGWRDILVRVWRKLSEDNISLVAAGVALNTLLAVFPAMA